MNERREYPREQLTAAMICALETRADSTFCLIKDVSVVGALVECPFAEEADHFDVGDAVSLRDVTVGDRALFTGQTCRIAWIYKRHIGLQFDSPLLDSVSDLRDWLELHKWV